MRLSAGTVRSGRLHCPYHNWSFDADGHGYNPTTPKQRVCANRLDATERYGMVWIRRTGTDTRFPDLAVDGVHAAGTHVMEFKAPLELVVDAFVEIEHTPTAHLLLGVDPRRQSEITADVQVNDDGSVRVVGEGPQRPIPRLLQAVLGWKAGDRCIDDITVRFSPLYMQHDVLFRDPNSGELRDNTLRLFLFFHPIDEGTTRLTALLYSTWAPTGAFGLNRILQWALVKVLAVELEQDPRFSNT